MIAQLIINSIVTGAVYTLIALGFNLMYGVSKFFNIAYGAVAVIGGYAVFFFFKTMGLNPFLSICTGICIAAVTGLLSDKLLFMPLRNRGASSLCLLVASLGLFTTLQSIVAILFSSDFRILNSDNGIPEGYRIFGGIVTRFHLLVIIGAVVLTPGLVFVLNNTKFGKAIKAVTDDEEVAGVVGINTNRIIGHTFLLGSAIAGISGIIVGFDTGLMPTIGMGMLLKGVTATIIGGAGNIYGGILGAFMLGFVENFGVWQISGQWKDSIAFGLLIVFLLFRPTGIFGE